MTDRMGVWESIERWRWVAFLAPGVAFLLIAINEGLVWLASTGLNLPPLVPLALLLIVYAGLLGLSPRLVARAPRLGRVCQVLVGVFVLEILIAFGVFMDPSSVPRIVLALSVATAIIGAALTNTVFGATSLWTGAYPRAVGGSLLLAAVGLSLLVGKVVLFGDIGGPQWLSVLYNGLFGLSLTAVGALLRTEAGSTERTESTETVA